MEHGIATYAEFQHRNPLRSPDWRWQRAWWLVRGCRHLLAHRDDEATRSSAAFIRSLVRCRSRVQLGEIAAAQPNLWDACRVEMNGGWHRLQLQARLLAGQTADQIAQRMRLPAALVDHFQALFFAIQDRLEARDYVVTRILQDPTDSAVATTLKALAYFGGPVVLENVLSFARPLPDGDEPDRKAASVLACQFGLAVRLQELDLDGLAAAALFRRILFPSGRWAPVSPRWEGILADLPLDTACLGPAGPISLPQEGSSGANRSSLFPEQSLKSLKLGELGAQGARFVSSRQGRAVLGQESVAHGVGEKEQGGRPVLLPFRPGEWPAAQDLLRARRGRPAGRPGRCAAPCAA